MNFNLKNHVRFIHKTMLIKTLLNSVNGLSQLQAKELPVVVSFKIGKVLKQVYDALETFENARSKRVKELGEEIKEKGEGTGRYNIKKSNLKTWEKDYEALINQEVKIDVPEIKLADLGDISLPSSVFTNLDWLIKE